MMIKQKIAKAAVGVGMIAATAAGSVLATTGTAQAQESYRGRVIADSLTVRWSASTHSSPYRIGDWGFPFERGESIPVVCKVTGTEVDGNDRWYDVGPGRVSARYVQNIGAAPQWCGDGRMYHGRTIALLNVRKGPNTDDMITGRLAPGSRVDILCKADDDTQPVDGNEIWYWTTGHNWVAARYVENVGTAPVWCGADYR